MTAVLPGLETHGDAAALLIVALLALGMALAFVAADRASPISHGMAAALASIGAAIGLNVTGAATMHACHDMPLVGRRVRDSGNPGVRVGFWMDRDVSSVDSFAFEKDLVIVYRVKHDQAAQQQILAGTGRAGSGFRGTG